MKNLDEDILFFLHDQLHLLKSLEDNLAPIKDIYDEDEVTYFNSNENKIFAILKSKIENLILSINNLIILCKKRNLNPNLILSLEKLISGLEVYFVKASKLNPVFLFDKLKQLKKIILILKAGPLPKEDIKKILNEIFQIQKLNLTFFIQTSNSILKNVKDKVLQFEVSLKSEDNELDVEYLPFELCSTIDNILLEFSLKYEQKKINIKKNYEGKKYYVLGSRPNIIRAFENLINNAIKYNRTLTNNEVWIEIKIHEETETISIMIENWGVGILKEEIEDGKIYQIGYRGKYSVLNKIEGQGYGLAFAKREIERNQGTINIVSYKANNNTPIITEDTNFLTRVFVNLKKAI